MANITIAGTCSVTKDGATSTLNGSFTADVDRVVELTRDLDTTFQSISGSGGGFSFLLIVNLGTTYVEWAVLPQTTGVDYVSGSIPPGGHALLPSFLNVSGSQGATTDLHLRSATGTGKAYVMYGTKPA